METALDLKRCAGPETLKRVLDGSAGPLPWSWTRKEDTGQKENGAQTPLFVGGQGARGVTVQEGDGVEMPAGPPKKKNGDNKKGVTAVNGEERKTPSAPLRGYEAS